MKTRREIIATSAKLMGGALAATSLPAHAQSVNVRYKATSPEGARNLAVLARAVRIMRGDDPAHPISREIKALGPTAGRHRFSWERQRELHDGPWFHHTTWRFFPWHRLQLAAFEAIVRHLTNTPSFALPYWDPREDQILPAVFFNQTSPLWMPNRRATPQTNFKQQLDQQLARGWLQMSYLSDAFPRFHGGPMDGALVPGTLDRNMHGAIHGMIGGMMSSPPTATLDPLFWLHHANIDRIWATWQQNHPVNAYYEARFLAEPIGAEMVHPTANIVQWRTREVLNTAAIGAGMAYRYDAIYELPGAPPPEPMPQNWRLIAPRQVSLPCERVAAPGAVGNLFRLQVPSDLRPVRNDSKRQDLYFEARISADAAAIVRAPFLKVSLLGPNNEVAWETLAPFVHVHDGQPIQIQFKLANPPEIEALLAADDGRLAIRLTQADISGAPIAGELDASVTAELRVVGAERETGAPQ